MSWLKKAIIQTSKPKETIIGQLKKQLGGQFPGRARDVVHASDVTKANFCPRKWAFLDLLDAKIEPEFVSTAMDVTYQMGTQAERLLVEKWAGPAAVGNWVCRKCNDQRTMVKNPNGYCPDGTKHSWRYIQLRVEAPEYNITGGIDCLFDVGVPRYMVTEIKTLNPTDFEKILIPQPEHRLRTNLYLKLVADSYTPYKDRINLHEARVLYISRGHGKLNPEWQEILPFKEFKVDRNDEDVRPMLQKAKALKLWRDTKSGMPSGICATAIDKYAKDCSQCKNCFSGQFPATIHWEKL